MLRKIACIYEARRGAWEAGCPPGAATGRGTWCAVSRTSTTGDRSDEKCATNCTQEGTKMKSGNALTAMVAAFLIFTAAALADQFRMRAGESNPAATGVIHANTDRNGNGAMELEAKHLAPPARLTPPHSTYVV